MNPALAGVALAVVIGAVVAGSARNARTAILGLVVALLVRPVPGRSDGRSRSASRHDWSARSWPATCSGSRRAAPACGPAGRCSAGRPSFLVAAAAAVVGYGSHGLGAPGAGPALAQAAGFALAALAVAPIANGRDVLRVGIGLVLLTSGAILVRTALGGTPEPLEQVVIAGLVAALGGAIAVLGIVGARRGRRLRARRGTSRPARRASDAHPVEAHPTDAR